MSTREIMASEQKALEYLMFFAKLGAVPVGGWDFELIDDGLGIVDAGKKAHEYKQEKVRRFVFEQRIVKYGKRTILRSPKHIWRAEICLKKKDGLWVADRIHIGYRYTSEAGGFSDHSFFEDDIRTIDHLIEVQTLHQDFPHTKQ